MKNTIMKSQLLILLIASFASAEQIQIEFSGELTRVDPGTMLGDEVTPGMIFYGTYLYEDTVEDSNPDSDEWGIYEFSNFYSQYTIHIDDYTFSAESYKIAVLNRGDNRDGYTVYSRTVIVSDGASSENWDLMQLSFGNAYGDPFESDSLDQIVSLDDWDHSQLTMHPFPFGPLVEGDITSFEYVPEPASLALLLVGGLAVVRWR